MLCHFLRRDLQSKRQSKPASPTLLPQYFLWHQLCLIGFRFLQPRPYTEYMNNRGCETRDATWQSGVARDMRTVWSRFAAVRPNKCPAWSTWKVLTDVLVNICGSRTFLADQSGKASHALSQHVGSWTRHPASGVRAAYPNVESPRPARPEHFSMTSGTQPTSQRPVLIAALADIRPQ